MKEMIVMLLAACLIALLGGCTVEKQADAAGAEPAAQAAGAASEDVLELTEKLYVTYINEIYTNSEDYLGRTIRLEGMFTSEYYEPNATTYYYVYRVGPGCCGNDGSMCGFEFTWDGPLPKDGDWIEVTGALDRYDLDDQSYLTLRATSVEAKAERGAETVYQ